MRQVIEAGLYVYAVGAGISLAVGLMVKGLDYALRPKRARAQGLSKPQRAQA